MYSLAPSTFTDLTPIPILGIIKPIMGISSSPLALRFPQGNQSLADALFPRVRQAVLRLLFLQADKRFLQKDIITNIRLGSGAVQRELERLSKPGIVVRLTVGREVYYQANSASPIFSELQGLVRKTLGIAVVLKDALRPVAGQIELAILFGSAAAGNEKASSDVDLLIVSDSLSLSDVMPAIQKMEGDLSREVNPMLYPTEEFRRNVRQGQNFLTNVVNGPKIFLIGDENDLRRLARKRLAQAARDK